MWLTRVGPTKVDHVPCPGTGQPTAYTRPKGVLHTTEGATIESALSVFRVHYAPTFLVGRDMKNKVRVCQLLPLGEMAAALENHPGGVETNREAAVQIEIVAHSKKTPWLPDGEVCVALGRLMWALRTEVGIPLRHRVLKRDPVLWVRASGWFGHADVPENEHWDPGALKYDSLFKFAIGTDTVSTRKSPRKVFRPYRLVRRANGIPYTEQS